MFKVFFCGETAKTVVHLFIHCKVTSQLWRLFLGHKNISWSMSGKITKAIHSWEEVGVHTKNRNNWRIVPAAIWWTIWKERNLRVFENMEHTIEQVKMNRILTLCF